MNESVDIETEKRESELHEYITLQQMQDYIDLDEQTSKAFNNLCRLISKNTVKWRNKPEKARRDALQFMIERGLYGDCQRIKDYIVETYAMLQLRGDVLGQVKRAGKWRG